MNDLLIVEDVFDFDIVVVAFGNIYYYGRNSHYAIYFDDRQQSLAVVEVVVEADDEFAVVATVAVRFVGGDNVVVAVDDILIADGIEYAFVAFEVVVANDDASEIADIVAELSGHFELEIVYEIATALVIGCLHLLSCFYFAFGHSHSMKLFQNFVNWDFVLNSFF